jgi:hypothetical protein
LCSFLPSQTDEIDDLFNFSTDVEESGNDLEFDASELEQIEMLETFRSKLNASSTPAPGGGAGASAARGGASSSARAGGLPLPSTEKK